MLRERARTASVRRENVIPRGTKNGEYFGGVYPLHEIGVRP